MTSSKLLEKLIGNAKERLAEEADAASIDWEKRLTTQYGYTKEDDSETKDEDKKVEEADDEDKEDKKVEEDTEVGKDTHDDEDKVNEDADADEDKKVEEEADGEDKEKVTEAEDDKDDDKKVEESDDEDEDKKVTEDADEDDDKKVSEDADADEDKKVEEEENDMSKADMETLTNVSEALAGLFAGSKLTKSFKTKATTIFEAALKQKVQEAIKLSEAKFKKVFDDKLAKIQESTDQRVDAFLKVKVQEWKEENKVALESSVRMDIAEGFMADMKTLFESYNIALPKEKVDLLDTQLVENANLKTDNNKLYEKIMDQDAKIFGFEKDKVIATLSEGLAATQSEKFKALVEDVEAKDIKTFSDKAAVIKEGFFKTDATKQTSKTKTEAAKEVIMEDTTEDKSVSHYVDRIRKQNMGEI